MGVGVSGWSLARAVSQLGELGVVSGTLLPVVFARLLQLGDPSGHLRFAMDHFPVPGIASRVWENYFVPGGKPADAPFKSVPMQTVKSGATLTELTVLANFAEVFLAKDGHAGRVGINLLEKMQMQTLPSLYGAMLADVDYVLMGAGIPRAIPGVLDHFAAGEAAELKIDVAGGESTLEVDSSFDPAQIFGDALPPKLKRPQFLAIVSSAALATTLARKSNGRVDGFVIEGDVAGGHNAPPRGALQLTAAGEPVYGPRDVPDLEKFRALGLPFWLAGSYARPEKLAEARALGAAGIQVGTLFAFCDESGIEATLKQRAVQASREGVAAVFTDPRASPTGFPFKVMHLEGSLSDADCYAQRTRVCDLGGLREAYAKPDGTIGYRCAAEPEEDYVRKGGVMADTVGRKCLCNCLLATIGLGQVRGNGTIEPPMVTAGNEVATLSRVVPETQNTFTAADAVHYLRS
jgi:NAD(P)H-dependent flavin oxidoreductase YrpB (nitropropane dioxygenase family)